MTSTLDEIFANPDYYLFMFDGDSAVFREMDRAAYLRSIFLDRRIDPKSDRALRLPIDPLLSHLPAVEMSETGWIFHVAHCGSTLLARGLDRPDGPLVLREPVPLRQLAIEGAGQPANAAWREGLRLVTAMLGRRYGEQGPTIVKANVPVNFALPEVMALDPDAKGILLYFGLDDYLRAILRSPDHRTWLNRVTDDLAPAIDTMVGPVNGLGDAERAAALWLSQMLIFDGALSIWPQLRSLDAEQMLAAPHVAIEAAAAYFGVAARDDLGDLTANHAKTPGVSFDPSARRERRVRLTQDLAGDLSLARRWIDDCPAARALPDRLARPLTGQSAALL